MNSHADDFHSTDDPALAEEQVLDGLRDPMACPDLTHKVMGQLGYMKASPVVVKRRIRTRWAQRSVLATAAMVSLFVGIHLFNQSEDARRPVGPPLDEAFESDIEVHQKRLGNVFQTIRRNLTPLQPGEAEPVENEGTPLVQPKPFSDVEEEEVPIVAIAFLKL